MTEYPPGSGPAGRTLSETEAHELLARNQFGVLAANKRNGHPQLTTVMYHWSDGVARISTTASRLKTRLLRNDPRAALHVSGDGVFAFAVIEALAELSEVSTVPGDATGQELLTMNPRFDTDEFRDAFLRQSVLDERVVIRLRPTRSYGLDLGID